MQSVRAVKLTTHLYLMPRSRMAGTMNPLPQHAFMAWCSVKKETQEQLYLYLTPRSSEWSLPSRFCDQNGVCTTGKSKQYQLFNNKKDTKVPTLQSCTPYAWWKFFFTFILVEVNFKMSYRRGAFTPPLTWISNLDRSLHLAMKCSRTSVRSSEVVNTAYRIVAELDWNLVQFARHKGVPLRIATSANTPTSSSAFNLYGRRTRGSTDRLLQWPLACSKKERKMIKRSGGKQW